MATAAELHAAVDAVKTAVAKVQAEIADLKTQIKPPTVDQSQLDANVTDLTTSANTLNGL